MGYTCTEIRDHVNIKVYMCYCVFYNIYIVVENIFIIFSNFNSREKNNLLEIFQN